MAEIATGLVVNGVTEILKNLIPMATKEIGMALGVNDDMRKLQDTLKMIVAVIVDAEKRQMNDEAVRVWLRRLKDAAYDADDVLDDFSYEVMRRGDQMRGLKDKVHNFASSSNRVVFSFKMAHKIKNINEKFDAITKDMRSFEFLATNPNTIHQSREKPNRITVSYVDVSKIVGRENDKSKIVKLLLNQYEEKVSVISIVGMGGLGKTTLTQLVYNDESVVKHFQLKIWVCVSDDFDVFKILRNIMEAITEKKCDDVSNVNLLVNCVQEKLTGKKYLLVLDDLWNENRDEWDKLKTWLNVGAQGSRILVSTRLDQVASVVRGVIPPYKLQKLSEAQCWSIIKKKAFSHGGAQETSNMINIGKEIVKKCCGLPLAAIFLGGLMHSKREEREWRSIKDQNDIWGKSKSENNIISILKLSYDNLPSHLKQCFSYCCIFPKDWVIKRERLIRLWMAEGFLPSSDGGNDELSFEDIGNEYFESLLSSSFFQDVEKDDLGDIKTCKMHDLRYLDVSYNINIEVLPDSITSLCNLRTLNISYTDIEVLPDSITSLCNLRTLEFHYCERLKALPRDFGKLKHLRSLDLRGTKIEVLPKSCTDNLTNLEIVHLGKCKLLNDKDITNWTKLRVFTYDNYSELDEMLRGNLLQKLLQKLRKG